MSRANRNDPVQLEGEEWRRVKEYPGYEVSNFGRFRSYWTPAGLKDKPRIKSIIFNRYMKVAVHTGRKNTLVSFAPIVARAFIGSPRGRIVINLDGDIRNCRLDNLAYVTREELGAIVSFNNYLKNGDNSSMGRLLAAQRRQEDRLKRALLIKKLRDTDRLTYKEIAQQVGMSESGVCRVYTGSGNQVLGKALAHHE